MDRKYWKSWKNRITMEQQERMNKYVANSWLKKDGHIIILITTENLHFLKNEFLSS